EDTSGSPGPRLAWARPARPHSTGLGHWTWRGGDTSVGGTHMAQRTYEGAGAATFLKSIAILVAAIATLGAVVGWATATQAHLSADGNIETGVNLATVLAGVLLLGEGILLAVLTYAVGVTVDHLIAIRRLLDSGATGLVPGATSIGAPADEPVPGP